MHSWIFKLRVVPTNPKEQVGEGVNADDDAPKAKNVVDANPDAAKALESNKRKNQRKTEPQIEKKPAQKAKKSDK